MMCVRSEKGGGFRAARNVDTRPTGCGNNAAFKPSLGANVRDSSRAGWQVANTPRPGYAGYPQNGKYLRFAEAERPQESWGQSIQSFFSSILEETPNPEPRSRNGLPRRSNSVPPLFELPPEPQDVYQREYPPKSPRFFAPAQSVQPIEGQRIEGLRITSGEMQKNESALQVPPQAIKEESVPLEKGKDEQKQKINVGFSALLGTPTTAQTAAPAMSPASTHRLGSTLHSELRGMDQDFTDLANDLTLLADDLLVTRTPKLSSEPATVFKANEASVSRGSENASMPPASNPHAWALYDASANQDSELPMSARTRARYDGLMGTHERITTIKKTTSTVLGHGDSIHSELRGLEQDVTQLTREMEALKRSLAHQDGQSSAFAPRAPLE